MADNKKSTFLENMKKNFGAKKSATDESDDETEEESESESESEDEESSSEDPKLAATNPLKKFAFTKNK